MNIAQQVIASMKRENMDSVPEMLKHARIQSIEQLKWMPDPLWCQVVTQRRQYILFEDGSKLCFYVDPENTINDDMVWSPDWPIILFWIIDKKQVENPQSSNHIPGNEWRSWVN